MIVHERVILNKSFLFVLLLFSGAIFLPYKLYFGNGLPVQIINVVVIFSILSTRKVNTFSVVIPILFSCYLLFLSVLSSYQDFSLSILIDYIRFGLLSYFLYLDSDDEKIINYGYKLSLIAFLAILFSLCFFGVGREQGEFNYMTFGNYMALSSLFFTIYIFLGRNIIFNLTLLVVAFVLILIFGNRGSLLVVFSMFIICLLFNDAFTFKKYLSLLFLMSIFVIFYFHIEEIALLIKSLMTDLGYYSYSIIKITNVILGDETISSSSSGRDVIYNMIYNDILNGGIKLYGIDYVYTVSKGEFFYSHNIFLDILLMFGIFGVGIIFLISIMFFTFITFCKNKYKKLLFLCFFSFSFTKLSFSSTFLIEPTFWIFLSVGFSMLKLKIDRKVFFNKTIAGKTHKHARI
ncbi:O-antigen polymerase [Shewanella sp. Isolate11]|uniref:O-antigen polymerase n=1 Tax=Shewanella sp. Isolate11 TaxID=2908530 RepID=UPI001EFD023D|nr:O-antigen polymerase [Shewanella sp. Isolate11]MCG9697108.1 oligosaccharide repeat unit polymerase [Shewanella sp. Isolate11]